MNQPGNNSNTVQLGKSQLIVSRTGLGTMTWGDQNTEAEAHAQLDLALASGINFIDTAEMYSVPPKAATYSKTETFIGTWLKHQQRDRIVLATKIAGPGRSLDWIAATRDGSLMFDRITLRRALEDSLKRLQTDYIDLYQLHWPSRNTPAFGQYQFDPAQERAHTPLQETLEALGELIKEGKIRAIGLSNETPWGVMQCVRLAEQSGLPRIATVQNAYNLLNRTWENGLAEIGFREGVTLLPYSPLAFGTLTGKYLDNPQIDGRCNLFPGYAQRYNKPNVAPAVAAYVALAKQHGLTPTALALGFVASRWFVGSTLIGATSITQLKENILACQTRLTDEILQQIEAIHLRYTNPAP